MAQLVIFPARAADTNRPVDIVGTGQGAGSSAGVGANGTLCQSRRCGMWIRTATSMSIAYAKSSAKDRAGAEGPKHDAAATLACRPSCHERLAELMQYH